jgi:type II secretory pathway component PulF
MPHFAYTAVGHDGKKLAGNEFADNRRSLELSLKNRRLLLVECKTVVPRRISLNVTVSFISQLSQLAGGGMVVERSLQIIGETNEDKRVAELAQLLRQGIKRGQSLSQALAQVGEFDPLLIPLVRAGEASGRMPEILGTLEKHFSARQKIRREILGNLTYPIVLVIANLLCIVGLGVKVIPVFKTLFEDRMDALPMSTHFIFWLSDFLLAHGMLLIALLLGSVAAIMLAVRYSEGVRASIDRLLLATPWIGRFLGKIQAANVTAVLGLLLVNGVPLVTAMELSTDVVSNSQLRRAMVEALNGIRRGRRVSTVFDAIAIFPKTVTSIITVGEETGTLGEKCVHVSENLRDQINVSLRALVALSEPVLILTMGALVAFVVMSMLVAVYSMTDLVR